MGRTCQGLKKKFLNRILTEYEWGAVVAGACQAFRMRGDEVIAGMESGQFNEPFLVGGICTYSMAGANLRTMLGAVHKQEGTVVQQLGGGRTRETNIIRTPEGLAGIMGVRGVPSNLDEMLKAGFDPVGVPVG